MAAGVPTIVSTRGSLPEVTKTGALHVDPADAEAVAEAMERALRDERLRGELRERGWRTVQRYSWRTSARMLASIYRRVHAASRTPALAGGAE